MSLIREVHTLVLGAGPAGLGVGRKLMAEDEDFLIIESKERVGGNCYTFWDGDFGFDSGAHRLHDKLEEVTSYAKELLGSDLQEVNRPSAIYKSGKYFTFPIQPKEVLSKVGMKNTLKILSDQIKPKPKGDSFEDVAVGNYGSFLAKEFLLNYSQKLWGVPCFELIPEVSGKRMKGLSLIEVFKETVLKREAKHIDGSFLYPKKGIYQLFEEMEKQLKEKIKLNEKVIQIEREQGRFKVSTENGVYLSEKLYSSLPVQTLSGIIDIKIKPKYRHLKLVMLKYNAPRFTDKATLYFPDKKYCFTRITEPKNRSEYLAPENQTSLVCEIPYFDNDNISNLTGEELVEKVIKQLPKEVDQTLILGAMVKDLRNAYPVLTKTFKQEMDLIKNEVEQVPGLVLIGRVGKFEYLHIHDLLDSKNL